MKDGIEEKVPFQMTCLTSETFNELLTDVSSLQSHGIYALISWVTAHGVSCAVHDRSEAIIIPVVIVDEQLWSYRIIAARGDAASYSVSVSQSEQMTPREIEKALHEAIASAIHGTDESLATTVSSCRQQEPEPPTNAEENPNTLIDKLFADTPEEIWGEALTHLNEEEASTLFWAALRDYSQKSHVEHVQALIECAERSLVKFGCNPFEPSTHTAISERVRQIVEGDDFPRILGESLTNFHQLLMNEWREKYQSTHTHNSPVEGGKEVT